MKTRSVQILFLCLCTVLAAALQDMLPSFGGTKPPVLTALVLAWALLERPADRRAGEHAPFFAASWIPAALLAGAFEDALSSFPAGSATGFLLLAGAVARQLRPTTRMLAPAALGLVAAMAAAPCHELWLGVCGVAGDDPSVIVRFFASALPAAPTGAVVFALLPRLVHASGYDGRGVDRRWA